MGELSKDFITQFHNLPGDSLTEKQHSLFQLLCQNQSLLAENEEQLVHVIRNLQPSTYLERIFGVDFLIFFRRSRELYQELQNGNEIVLFKINKQKWFFQGAFKDLAPEQIVNNVLPTVSSHAKLKILKNLPVNEQQADEIFDAVSKRYGTFPANTTLAKCSSAKISQILKSKQVKLTFTQLKKIYNKDPSLVAVYLEERTKHEGDSAFMNKNRFFLYLAQKNPSMFSEFFEKYQFDISLGRKTTAQFIKRQKSNILSDLELYVKILNLNSLVKQLGGELSGLFFKKNPQRGSEMYWKSLLKHYPKRARFSVYKSAYDATHHVQFGKNADTITEDVLKLITDPEQREKFARLKLEKEEDDVYLTYVDSKYCLNEFVQKLSNMTVTERIKYVKIATGCALLNDDLDSLLKICELVARRFRNDNKKLRYDFFSAFGWDNRIFDRLTEQHWGFIMEIVATIKANGEWVWNERAIRFKYLEYLINQNKPIKEILSKYSDWLDQISYESRVWRDLTIYKTVLSELIEAGLPESADKKAVVLYNCRLIYTCLDYNKKNPEDIIDIFEDVRILERVKFALENYTFDYPHSVFSIGVEYVICRKSLCKEMAEAKRNYFKFFKAFGGLTAVCLWFLQHEPEPLVENFDKFLDDFLAIRHSNDEKFWRLIKKYSHLELDRRTVDFCTQKLKESNSDKSKIARILSKVAPAETYFEFIKREVSDSFSNDTKAAYLISCELLKYLPLTQSSKSIFYLALQSCKGQYLKFVLNPLYSSVYKLPESNARLFIEKIGEDKGISSSKHAFNLSCIIFDEEMIHNYLKNTSLTSVLRYFGKNPCDALWEIVKHKLIETRDEHLLKHAMKLKIPPKYKSEYLDIVIDKSDSLELRKKLLMQVKDIPKPDPQLAEKIAKSCIFQIDADDFIAKLLLHVADFGSLSGILAEFRENSWRKSRDERRKLYRFVQNVLKTYLRAEGPHDFADNFIATFESVFSPSEVFAEYVMIRCLKLKGESVENCGRLLKGLNGELVRSYGAFVTNLFADVVNREVLPVICKSDNERIELCYSIFGCRESDDDALLVLGLLPECEPEGVEYFGLYDEILDELAHSSNNSVQLQYNLYLKSETVQERESSEADQGFCYRC